MGNQVSTVNNNTSILNDVLTSVLYDSSSSCKSSSGSNQVIKFTDLNFENCDVDFSNISQSADITTNFSCLQNNSQNSDLQNKFANKLDEKIKSIVSGIPIIGSSKSSTDNINNIVTDINNNISIKSIAECVNNTLIDQNTSFSNITVKNCKSKVTFNNITQQIILNHVTDCVQKDKQLSTLSNKLDTAVKTAVSSSNTNQVAAASSGTSTSSISSLILLFLILPMLTSSNQVTAASGTSMSSISSLILLFLVLPMLTGSSNK